MHFFGEYWFYSSSKWTKEVENPEWKTQKARITRCSGMLQGPAWKPTLILWTDLHLLILAYVILKCTYHFFSTANQSTGHYRFNQTIMIFPRMIAHLWDFFLFFANYWISSGFTTITISSAKHDRPQTSCLRLLRCRYAEVHYSINWTVKYKTTTAMATTTTTSGCSHLYLTLLSEYAFFAPTNFMPSLPLSNTFINLQAYSAKCLTCTLHLTVILYLIHQYCS